MDLSVSDSLTRPIYWSPSPSGSLPKMVVASQYVFLVLATIIMLYGIWARFVLWRQGKPEICTDQPFRRLSRLFWTVLGQGKVLKSKRTRKGKTTIYGALMHGLIFYGFMALFFGTTIVFLKDYGIIDLYKGWHYVYVSFICEVGGLALMLGLGMGIFRRQTQPKEFPHAIDYSWLYVLLFLLCLQGYFLEGIRLNYQVSENYFKPASFAGLIFGFLVPSNLTPTTAGLVYNSLWFFHMLTTMAFLALLPYTRAFHIVSATLNLYTMRLEPINRLSRLDLENEDAEYFGPKYLKDFSWKSLLDFESCTECRKCTDICPASLADKVLDPRKIMLKLKDMLQPERQLALAGGPPTELFESGVITKEEIWGCTNCGACVSECPVGIDQLRTILDLRRYQTLSLGELPEAAAVSIQNTQEQANPWGLSPDDRLKWAEGHDVNVLKPESEAVEWLYWVGCAGAFDAANQKVAQSMIKIFQKTKTSYGVIGKEERCTGDSVKRLGDEYTFSQIAKENINKLKQYKFKKIVAACPHCFNTFKNDYPEYGGDFEVVHHTQFLADLQKKGQLQFKDSTKPLEATFHDPCFLGRHNDEYDAPRNVFQSIPGAKLTEMNMSKEKSHCCGMGGGNMWYESEGGVPVVKERLKQIGETKQPSLVTACSFCLINFKGSQEDDTTTKNMDIQDLAQIVANQMV
jgi:Fe-S oxidoreductase/nitrate reductase gamma subunit